MAGKQFLSNTAFNVLHGLLEAKKHTDYIMPQTRALGGSLFFLFDKEGFLPGNNVVLFFFYTFLLYLETEEPRVYLRT